MLAHQVCGSRCENGVATTTGDRKHRCCGDATAILTVCCCALGFLNAAGRTRSAGQWENRGGGWNGSHIFLRVFYDFKEIHVENVMQDNLHQFGTISLARTIWKIVALRFGRSRFVLRLPHAVCERKFIWSTARVSYISNLVYRSLPLNALSRKPDTDAQPSVDSRVSGAATCGSPMSQTWFTDCCR